MIAVFGGLSAAAFWATSVVCCSWSSKLIGPFQVLAWVMLVGLLVTLPVASVGGIPENLGGRVVWWFALSGCGSVIGALLMYAALRVGMVSVVAPIVSTGGAIAAGLAAVTGEVIGIGVGAMLGVIVLGVVLASIAPGGGSSHPRTAAMLAAAAACCFGLSLYATARVSSALPLVWALLPARFVGTVAVALPLALAGRLRLTREAAPLVIVSGVSEVIGFALYAYGSRRGIAVSAVLSSQFAALAAVFAYVVMRERLNRLQLVGIAAIAAGVSVVSVLQA